MKLSMCLFAIPPGFAPFFLCIGGGSASCSIPTHVQRTIQHGAAQDRAAGTTTETATDVASTVAAVTKPRWP